MESTRVRTHPLPSARFIHAAHRRRNCGATACRSDPMRPSAQNSRPSGTRFFRTNSPISPPTFQPVEAAAARHQGPEWPVFRRRADRHEAHRVGLRCGRSSGSDVHRGSGSVECPGCRAPRTRARGSGTVACIGSRMEPSIPMAASGRHPDRHHPVRIKRRGRRHQQEVLCR